jgi:hypothetical protein
MLSSDKLHESDPAVVARYLHLRNYFHDQLLEKVDKLLSTRYEVQPTRRIPSSLTTLVRNGYFRPDEGEIWPIVFVNTVDITLALFIQLSNERLADLGTVMNGPRPVRHLHWEEMWGWEMPLAAVQPRFFTLEADAQAEALLNWYTGCMEWLVRNGLMKRKAISPVP